MSFRRVALFILLALLVISSCSGRASSVDDALEAVGAGEVSPDAFVLIARDGGRSLYRVADEEAAVVCYILTAGSYAAAIDCFTLADILNIPPRGE